MFYNIEKKKREGFKHLSSFLLFNRFSFLYLYSYISVGRKCSNVRISSPFPSSIILNFFSHSSHAIHLLPNLTENKEREEKRKEKPDPIHSDENGETVSDRFKRYPTILLTATTNLHSEMAGNHQSYSPRFQNSPGDGTNKIQQRFNEDVWRNGGCGTSSRSFQRVPIEGAGAPNCRRNGKRARRTRVEEEGWFLTGTRFPVDLDVFVEIRFHEAVSDGPEEERKEPRDPLWRTALCDPIPPGDLDSWLVPLRVWSL